jgi:hypothetical protein
VAGIGERTEFEHGSARERIVRRDYASETATTPVAITHYVGGAEVIRRFRDNCSAVNSALTIRREIAGVVVLHELPLATTGCESAPPRLVRQLRLTDHLGSTDALLAFDGTAVSGAAGRQSFDAFGLRRDGGTWAALSVQARRTRRRTSASWTPVRDISRTSRRPCCCRTYPVARCTMHASPPCAWIRTCPSCGRRTAISRGFRDCGRAIRWLPEACEYAQRAAAIRKRRGHV